MMAISSDPSATALGEVQNLLAAVCERNVDLAQLSILPDIEQLRGPFRVGAAAGSAVAGIGVVLAELIKLSTGRSTVIEVDPNRAAATLIGLSLATANGEPLAPLPPNGNPTNMTVDNPTVGLYECADGRWIHLHGGLPHLREPTLSLLRCSNTVEDVGRAVREWDSFGLESELAALRACGAVVRSPGEWQDTEQGRAVRALGPVKVDKVADSPVSAHVGGRHPLEGVRVLDFTRVLAGPTCGKVLAQHGADVLAVNSPHVPDFPNAFVETSQGKRSAFLDLTNASDLDVAVGLSTTCDVVVNSYRSGALDRFGMDAGSVCQRSPGRIYVSINCYGTTGPWQTRPGWEHLAQTVSGMVHTVGELNGEPDCLPVTVCDYVTGYLAALGAIEALYRRALYGGSYHVRASLCQTAAWVLSLGIEMKKPRYLTPDLLLSMADYTSVSQSPMGTFGSVDSPLRLDGQRIRTLPPARLGGDSPVWAG